MPKLSICPYCNEEITKDMPSKKYKEKKYHLHCYNKYCEEIYNKNPSTNISAKRPSKTTPEELYAYICKLFGLEELDGRLAAQLKNLFAENNFTYTGVKLSLKYFYEIKGNQPDMKYGIGIVPYIYKEAESFFIKKQKVEKDTKNKKIEKTKEIKIVYKPKPKKPKQYIDINSL